MMLEKEKRYRKGSAMKKLMIILAAVLFGCSVLAAGSASADRAHAAENLYVAADYLVFSPEYSDTKGIWEMWVLAYQTGSGNHTGLPNDELDRCVSASLLPRSNSGAAAGTISALIGASYELEDMMDMDGIRYYMYYNLGRPSYLATPGGELTPQARIDMLEIHETRDNQRILVGAKCSNPSFALLCQLWLYAGRFSQKPSSVTKTSDYLTELEQPLYSGSVSDYCSNQEKLQRYCDSLMPPSAGSSGSTYVYYRKGGTELNVSPSSDGIIICLDSSPR